MQGLLQTLRKHWGYSSFLPCQAEAVDAISRGQDTLVVLPTGGGKSICYQLPAVSRGKAIVVSPLISLMQDQVAALRQHGVKAAFLNSSNSGADGHIVSTAWRAGELNLLYVAPERLLMPAFLTFIENFPPDFFAIDEAHCISHWGHDFRPEYRNLKSLRTRFPKTPLCAFTATATPRVRKDIIEQLAMREPAVIIGDFDRPNLHYRAEQRRSRNTQVEEVLRAHEGKSGIVYCISRRDAEALAGYLLGRGFRVAAYHAGLTHEVRRRVQREFSEEKLDTVVATVAFGMGIDRSNVRYVVHAAMPASIEHYQQETGRAGRDNLPAECVLLYSAGDRMKWRHLYEKDETIPADQLESKIRKLDEMMQFAWLRGCRHKYLVEYFGQAWEKSRCSNCDNCGAHGSAAIMPDSTVLAQKILSCVVRLNEGYGGKYVTMVLRGETENVQPVHCGLSTFGIMPEHPARDIMAWIDELVSQQLLVRSADQYPTLAVSADGWLVLRRQREVVLTKRVTVSAAERRQSKQQRIREHSRTTDMQLSENEQMLFEALRAMRLEIAREKKLPAYVILHDSTLVNIARACPTSLSDFAEISGMGELKIAMYGEKILGTCEKALPISAPSTAKPENL